MLVEEQEDPTTTISLQVVVKELQDCSVFELRCRASNTHLKAFANYLTFSETHLMERNGKTIPTPDCEYYLSDSDSE